MSDAPREPVQWHDPIVAEVRAARRALFAASGDDIHEFCRRARERQAASGHAIMRTSQPSEKSLRTKPSLPPA